jgi:hypothetical protein
MLSVRAGGDLQQQGQGYPTPKAMFEALDLYGLTQQSSYDFFQHTVFRLALSMSSLTACRGSTMARMAR